jgi:antitoxin VapB
MYIQREYTLKETAMTVPVTTLFKSNRTQAVRLPKSVAFPETVKQVEILKVGNSLVITPVGQRWTDFFLNGPRLSEDFERPEQPPVQEREPF